MNEEHLSPQASRYDSDLDQRLSAYYGPPLWEQPLASSSWQAIRAQLTPRRSFKRRFTPIFQRRSTGRSHVPAFIQQAFISLAHEAHVGYRPDLLACSLRFNKPLPHVRVSLLGKHPIRLILSLHIAHSLTPAELDVLLATGLARYLSLRKPAYFLLRLLLNGIFPFTIIALALLVQHGLAVFLIATIIGVSLCMLALRLLYVQGRSMAFQADTLIVLWLGRSRACQGLHALADRGRSSRRWSEPALAERIERVCGVQVAPEQDRLTLVR